MTDPATAQRRTSHLRVRYYPRRMDRAAAPGPVTPSQALHLPTDPARAASVESTAPGLQLQSAAREPRPVEVTGRGWTPPAPVPRRGRIRAWLRGLFHR